CSHNGSKGIIVSHVHAVVPYGKSHKIMSTLPSGIRFIPSKQSSLYIRFNSTFTLLPINRINLFVLCVLLCVLMTFRSTSCRVQSQCSYVQYSCRLWQWFHCPCNCPVQLHFCLCMF